MKNREHPTAWLNQRLELLKGVSIFSKTHTSILLNVAEELSELNVEAQEMVIKKGDIGETMYIIGQGSVKVHDGDYEFAVLKSKQVFGEYALLDAEKRSASVTALEPTQLWVLNRAAFYNIMLKHTQILQGILHVLVARSRLNNTLQEDLEFEKRKIEEQNQFIRQINEEILAQNDEIKEQKEFIEEQNSLLHEQNLLIKGSIEYAKTIQSALLPKIEDIHKRLPESFLFYKPRDIVSGDFYWVSSQEGAHKDKLIIASVDCTGHGVPGAFMSVLGTTYLRQIVDIQGIWDVAEVLRLLNQNIRLVLKQKSGVNQDGMEMSICLIDKANKKLEFAGAKSPIVRIKGQDLELIQGDNIPIGGYHTDQEVRTFTRHVIEDTHNTTFYLFSDGYRDQFGEATNKRFFLKRFKQLLLDVAPKPMDAQREILEKTHIEWKGDELQTDDIIVWGFRV